VVIGELLVNVFANQKMYASDSIFSLSLSHSETQRYSQDDRKIPEEEEDVGMQK
jgi:hypothetical protein